MIKRIHTKDYNFYGDNGSGLTLRWGKTLNDNPAYAPWPELADISISNYCTKNCGYCYRDSNENGTFMSLTDYEHILDQLTSPDYGPVFQVALGGGEPLEHPDFMAIIEATVQRKIVPNFTTNGLHLTEETVEKLKGKVGAIALSAAGIRDIDPDKVKIMNRAGIKTNIHFVLSHQTIDEAIGLLEGRYNHLLEGVNGLIFLTYKPKGRAEEAGCLRDSEESYQRFLALANVNHCAARIGFDACFVPPLLHSTDVTADYVDSCECGFFSIYVDEWMTVKPCSFSLGDQFSFSLREYSFAEIWKEKLEPYRNLILSRTCVSSCKNKSDCRGACPYYSALNFCYQAG